MKKVFRFEDYKGKYVMNCKTSAEEKEFCEFMDKHGFTWWDKTNYIDDKIWENNEEDMCYNFNNGTCSSRQYYKENKYTILNWSDFKGERNNEK